MQAKDNSPKSVCPKVGLGEASIEFNLQWPVICSPWNAMVRDVTTGLKLGRVKLQVQSAVDSR